MTNDPAGLSHLRQRGRPAASYQKVSPAFGLSALQPGSEGAYAPRPYDRGNGHLARLSHGSYASLQVPLGGTVVSQSRTV